MLVLRLANVGGWRSHARDLAHLRIIVALRFILRLLRRIVSSLNLLLHFHAVLDGLRALLVWQVVILNKLVFVRGLALFVGERVVYLVLHNHLFE